MILISPIGSIVLLILAAPYIYGWLRVEIYIRTLDLDIEMADAWFKPKYKHYIKYLEVVFFQGRMCGWKDASEEEISYYAPKIRERLNNAKNLPKYILEDELCSDTFYRTSKIRSLWRLLTGQIKLTRLE